MTIYITSFLLTILLIWLAENKAKSQKVKIILMVLAVIPMFIVSAIRYNVGTDYNKRYVADYLTLTQGKDVINLEIGFKLIDYICLLFTKEPYMIFFITSLIILAIIFEVIYKKSVNSILSVTIFFLGGYFFGTLNLIRQYIAIAFILLGYQFFMSNNKKKAYIGFTICAVLAFLMHSTSIVCFIILLLNKKNLVSAKWVLPISAVILILNENIMLVLAPIIKNTRFNVYLTGNMSQGELSILPIIENLLLYLWMYGIYYYNTKNDKGLDKEGIILLNIQGIAFILTVAGVVHVQSMRIAIYFWIFQILSIPYFLKIMPFGDIKIMINSKLHKEIKEETIKIVTYILIVLCFCVMFIYTNILNNDNEVVPYQTIFSRDWE